MRVGAVLEFSRRTLPQLLRCIPDLLRDDGFMGISKNDQLVLGCLAAFLDFEILADRLAKDRVSQIFLFYRLCFFTAPLFYFSRDSMD